jgi:hypothetical protein
MYSNKNVRGGSNISFNITNSDINASWLTATADTITANDALYVNTMDVEATMNLKQNIVDATTDLTVNDLTITGEILGNVSFQDDTMYISQTNNNVGINTITPESAIHCLGTLSNTSPSEGIHLGRETSTKDYRLKLVSALTQNSTVDFCEPNDEYLSRIEYEASTSRLNFYVGNSGTPIYYIDSGGTYSNLSFICSSNIGCTDFVGTGTGRFDGHVDLNSSCTIDSDFKVTDGLYLDQAEGKLMIGDDTEPEAGLHVRAKRIDATPTKDGILLGQNPLTFSENIMFNVDTASGGDNALIHFRDNQTGNIEGLYDFKFSTNEHRFYTSGLTEQFSISPTLIDCKDNNLQVGGDISSSDGSLNFVSDAIIDGDFQVGVSPNILLKSDIGTGMTTIEDLTVNNDISIGGNITSNITANCPSYFQIGTTPSVYVNTTTDTTYIQDARIYNDIRVDDKLSIGGASESALSIFGLLNNVPLTAGMHCGIKTDDSVGINLCNIPGTSPITFLNFCEDSNAFDGQIEYNLSTHIFDIKNNGLTQLTLSQTEANFQDNSITTSGNLTVGNISCTDIITLGTCTLQDNVNIYGDLDVSGTISGTFVLDDITTSGTITGGDLIVDTNLIYTDSTNNRVGINNSAPDSCLHIQGTRDASPSLGVHIGSADGGNYGIAMVSTASYNSILDFNNETERKASIIHDNTDNELRFYKKDNTANSGNIIVITNNEIELNDDVVASGDFTVDTNTLYVDSTNDRVGINTTSPGSALHVQGNRENSPNLVGVHLGKASDDYGIELCSETTNSSNIDFTTPSYGRRAAIRYDHPNDELILYQNGNSNNGGDVVVITNNEVTCYDDFIVDSGHTITGDISPCTGQMIAITCESNETLVSNSYPFSYGQSNQSSGVFGINLGEGSWKLMSFGFNSHDSPNNFTDESRLSIEIIKNNTATGDYLFMDWSSDRAHQGQNRYSDVPSSSISSQVDHQPTYTSGNSGDSYAFRIKTVTSCHSGLDEHRLTTHWMRMDAPRII